MSGRGQADGREAAEAWSSIAGGSVRPPRADALPPQTLACAAVAEQRVLASLSHADQQSPSPISYELRPRLESCTRMGQGPPGVSVPGLMS